jgi:hypothetical protein
MVEALLKLSVLERSHLEIAKELIELKFNVKVITIDFEDGSGKKFIVTTTNNPLIKQFVKL